MIKCPSCKSRIGLSDFVNTVAINCRRCGTDLQIHYFPALFKSIDKGENPELIISDEEASCFKHAEKKASSICNSCGVYICSLCELKIREKTFCPSCFNNNNSDQAINPFNKKSILFSKIALSISSVGLLFTIIGLAASSNVLTIIACLATGPYVLYYGYKNFKKEESIINGRSPIKFGIAIGLASAQIIIALFATIRLLLEGI